MAKVVMVQVVYNSRRFIEPVFSAMFGQTYADAEVVAVISGNDDGGKECIAEKFPRTKIIDPGYNIGFAKGHNLVFEQFDSAYFQLVNPDLIMEPDYVEKLVAAMEADAGIGAATGKLYKIPNDAFQISKAQFAAQKSNFRILDSTGVTIRTSGRAYDRGQHETDNGQYDGLMDVQAVSAAGAMYRKAALENVKYPVSNAKQEYFDEDFHSYWEDVDLAWRMKNAGWKNRFVPAAVAYHGRGAGSSKGGYKKVVSYVAFHRQLNPRIRQLNYRNHIFLYLKNSPWPYPQFFVREFFMLGYVILFEIGTLKILPDIFRLLPRMWRKRKQIKKLRYVDVSK